MIYLTKRVFVRLGAVDKYAFGDGPHKNARLIYAEKYPGYNESEHNLGKDIGVLYLESDVEFTGETVFFEHIKLKIT